MVYVDEQGNPVAKPADPEKMMDEAERLIKERKFVEALPQLEKLKEMPTISADMRLKTLYYISDCVWARYADNPLAGFEPIVSATSEAMNFDLRSPRVPEALLRLGLVNVNVGNLVDAGGYIVAMYRRYPDYPGVAQGFTALGKAQLKRRMDAQAEQSFAIVLDKYPESSFLQEASVGLAQALNNQRKYTNAQVILDFISKRWPRYYIEDPTFLFLQGANDEALDKPVAALTLYWLYYNLVPGQKDNDDLLLKMGDMRRLDIDPTRVSTGWVMDFCAQALRNVIIGMEGDGRRNDGFMMRSHFDITVASEVMSILSVARDLADLRQRMGRMVLALDRNGRPVTTADLEVDGAMTAWLVEAIKPNLIQTIEGQPVLVHTGPFGNIALGQSSVIADRVGLKLGDIHVTESGFAAEMGYEKFWNLKCRYSGLAPDAAVIVATVRALKHHGGAPQPRPGQPLPEEYLREDVGLVEAGCVNLLHHIGIVRRSGVPSVVCINKFYTDKPAEIAAIRRICEKAGASVAVSEHWEKGGEGALELADAVMTSWRSG